MTRDGETHIQPLWFALGGPNSCSPASGKQQPESFAYDIEVKARIEHLKQYLSVRRLASKQIPKNARQAAPGRIWMHVFPLRDEDVRAGQWLAPRDPIIQHRKHLADLVIPRVNFYALSIVMTL